METREETSTRYAYRVFQGKELERFYADGSKPKASEWFYEPTDYDHWQVYGYGYDTKADAIDAAETDVELDNVQLNHNEA